MRKISTILFPTSVLHDENLLKIHEKTIEQYYKNNEGKFLMGEDIVADKYQILTNGRDLFTDTMVAAGLMAIVILCIITPIIFLLCTLIA